MQIFIVQGSIEKILLLLAFFFSFLIPMLEDLDITLKLFKVMLMLCALHIFFLILHMVIYPA